MDQQVFLNESFSKEILATTLIEFLRKLCQSQDFLKNTSMNILIKYTENKSIEKIKKARALFVLYQKNMSMKKEYSYKKIFKRWHYLSRDMKNTMSKFYPINSTEPSWAKREKEEIRNCTFKPTINTSNNANANGFSYKERINSPVFDRLYTDHQRYTTKKNNRIMEQERHRNNQLSFQPDLSPSQVIGTEKNIKTRENNVKNIININNLNNFFQRQDVFRNIKEKNQERIRNEMEEEIRSLYTFTPEILKSSYSLHTGLYAQNNNQIINTSNSYSNKLSPRSAHSNSKIKNNRIINHLAKSKNHGSNKSMNRSYSNQAFSKSTDRPKKKVDYNKIEELYNDYKKIKSKKQFMQKEIDHERGFTYKPEINEKYAPKMGFLERNYKLLDDKKHFVNLFSHMYQENLRRSPSNDPSKKYTHEEKEEITKSIIDRLYIKGKEKTLIRNAQENHIDRVDLANILRQENYQKNEKNERTSLQHSNYSQKNNVAPIEDFENHTFGKKGQQQNSNQNRINNFSQNEIQERDDAINFNNYHNNYEHEQIEQLDSEVLDDRIRTVKHKNIMADSLETNKKEDFSSNKINILDVNNFHKKTYDLRNFNNKNSNLK